MTTDKDIIKSIYTSKIESIDTSKGFSLTAKRIKTGWLVIKWYERNQWCDPKLERKVLFTDDGKIFEEHKQIGTF